MKSYRQYVMFSNQQSAAAFSASGLDVTDNMLTVRIALIWFVPLSLPFCLPVIDIPFWDGIWWIPSRRRMQSEISGDLNMPLHFFQFFNFFYYWHFQVKCDQNKTLVVIYTTLYGQATNSRKLGVKRVKWSEITPCVWCEAGSVSFMRTIPYTL